MTSAVRFQLPKTVLDLALGPLDDRDRPSVVARRLEQAIFLGLVADGEALPPESELAAQMNVSVMTVRMSLATLRGRGLIETRRGRTGGNFVRLADGSAVEAALRHLLELNLDSIRDRRDYYSAIAAKSAELAARRAAGRVITRLSEAAVAIGNARSAGEAVQYDARFHLELAASTRSSMLTQAVLASQNDVTALLWIPGHECQSVESCLEDHREIMDAVRRKDSDLAGELAERHLVGALNQLIETRMRLGSGEVGSGEA